MKKRQGIHGEVVADDGFARVEDMGGGVYAVLSDPSKGNETVCNGGFIVGREGALLIEGYASPAGARWAVRTLRRLSHAPIRAAVLTHHHWDHSLGLAYYGGEGIPVISHPEARRLIFEHCLMQEEDRSRILAAFMDKVEKATDPYARSRAGSDLEMMKTHLDLTDVVHGIPNRPLNLEAMPFRMDLGGKTVLIEAHPGHAPDNIVVRLPDRHISFTGDLICHQVYPIFFSCDGELLLKELQALAAWGPDEVFVPGHGSLCGQAGLAALAEVIADLKGHARRMFDRKATLDEAISSYCVPEKHSDWEVVSWDFSIGMAMRWYYGALAGRAD